ncbi:FimV family protein [Nitrosospira sp. NpAV]|uniref:type IV pilus assembly protein FimV n=1 Tax=Nitrosospira sp. NpAV TaxID=58133 RepID=UPI0012EB4221|nr:FimV/HubP family polar landmark protein [Nitrosospira sp. NpAV]
MGRGGTVAQDAENSGRSLICRCSSQECAAVRKPVSEVCLLLIVLLSPLLVHAAGLGRLTVNSALGQPFKAEINLTIEKEEKGSLTARLAPREIFRQANIDYAPLLSTFKASIESHSDGSAYIRVTSPQPVSEPLLNILMELNWPSGRVLREYTVILAPPEIDAQPSITPVSQTHPPAPVKAESIASEQLDIPVKNPVTGGNPANPATTESAFSKRIYTVYGPVKYGDTLAGIVKNIAPLFGVSFNQMLVAVHRANRDAFFGNNMHQLRTGPILRIPDNGEIGAIAAEEADREVKIQTVDWWSRRKVAGMAGAAKELKQTDTVQIESAADAGILLLPPATFPQAGLVPQPDLAKSIRVPEH